MSVFRLAAKLAETNETENILQWLNDMNGSDAMKVFRVASKLAESKETKKILLWLKNVDYALTLAQKKARRFQAELLLVLNGPGAEHV